jgi:hypothetical protein
MPMLAELTARPVDGRRLLFWGARHEEELFARGEIESLCRASGVDLRVFLTAPRPGWTGGEGRITAAIVDGVASLLAMPWMMLAQGEWRDERGVNLLDGGAPWYDVYEAADGGWLAVGALEAPFYAALLAGLELADEVAHVFQRFACRHLEAGERGAVAHADSEAKAASAELVDEGGGMGIVVGMPRVHIGDGRAERDLRGRERERFAEPEAVAEARAVETGESFLFEPPGHVDRRLPPSGDGGEAHRGFARGHHETALPQRSR